MFTNKYFHKTCILNLSNGKSTGEKTTIKCWPVLLYDSIGLAENIMIAKFNLVFAYPLTTTSKCMHCCVCIHLININKPKILGKNKQGHLYFQNTKHHANKTIIIPIYMHKSKTTFVFGSLSPF